MIENFSTLSMLNGIFEHLQVHAQLSIIIYPSVNEKYPWRVREIHEGED